MFRLIVPATTTVEVNGAVQVAVSCCDGEVEILIELAVPEKPPVPIGYWQDTDPVEDEPLIPNAPRPRDPEDELPF